MAKMAFLMVKSFFKCIFKNTDQEDICVSIVFKAESKQKQEEQFFWGGFFIKNQKQAFLGVQNGSF